MGKTSSPDALVPGMNVPYGLEFKGLRERGRPGHGGNSGRGAGPGWREMGIRKDKSFCFASLPGSAGRPFMGEVRVYHICVF